MNYLYSYPARLVFDDVNRQPGDLSFDQEYGGRFVYLSGSPLTYPDGILINSWDDNSGNLGEAISGTYLEMRPVGNLGGAATGILRHHHFAGHAPRHMQEVPVADTLPQYPADNQPIVLTMDRWYDETPGFEGWGWKATVEFYDPSRIPNARAIGIYNDAGVYQYTTGAFVLTSLGDDVSKWQTHSPPGFATTEKEDVYYALLLGSTPEGKTVLPATKDSQQSNFWEADQVIPGGEAWVDSGETVTGMAGTVALVSDVAPFAVGSQVRIEGAEALVTSIWAGQGLVLDPYAARTTGATIEIWQ